jgi:hypothetical protein
MAVSSEVQFSMRVALVFPLVAFLAAALASELIFAQATPGYYPGSPAFTTGVRTASYQQTTGRSNPALNFYGGSKALAYAPQSPIIGPETVQVRTAAPGKPFAGVQQRSNVTPYLALDFAETPTALPNYYLFVRPQLEQQQHAQTERAQFRRLQQQLRKAEAGGAVSNPNGGIPTTGYSSQFMNRGGYYPSMK